jgi:hypothetical protein
MTIPELTPESPPAPDDVVLDDTAIATPSAVLTPADVARIVREEQGPRKAAPAS